MSNIVLSDQQKTGYERDGYLIFDPEIPASVLDGAIADLSDRYQSEGRIQDAWKTSLRVKAIALAPAVLKILLELYGREPLPFQTLNFPVGTQQPVHSDTIHFNSQPTGFMSGVWVALEDIEMDAGPVVYYPGSHKLPELILDDVVPTAREGFHGTTSGSSQGTAVMTAPLPPPADLYPMYYEPYIADMIARSEMKPHYATLKKGQAFLWAANLLHGGSPQTNKSRTRHSQVTHYYYEGCTYYTPLFSDEDNVHWRNPERIS